ncbi:hypothetical protein QJQ45_004074 [Haematococcus lacustris]|nr:hypothetical protein QJQ45_004074 [Haematococcus lacustris]
MEVGGLVRQETGQRSLVVASFWEQRVQQLELHEVERGLAKAVAEEVGEACTPLAGVRTFRAAAANETEAAPVGPATLMRRMGTVALSLFMPYKQLPPEGRMIDKLEEECDPYERNCRVSCSTYLPSHCSAALYDVAIAALSERLCVTIADTDIRCHGVGHVRHVSGLHPSELHDGSPSAAAMASPLAVLRKVPADAEHGSRVAAAPMKRHLHIEQEPAASVPANGSGNASSSGTGGVVVNVGDHASQQRVAAAAAAAGCSQVVPGVPPPQPPPPQQPPPQQPPQQQGRSSWGTALEGQMLAPPVESPQGPTASPDLRHMYQLALAAIATQGQAAPAQGSELGAAAPAPGFTLRKRTTLAGLGLPKTAAKRKR